MYQQLQCLPSPLLIATTTVAELRPAPVLHNAHALDLDWTYSSANPDGFAIETSPDGSTGWVFFDEAGGNTRFYTPVVATMWYRLTALDGSGNVVSQTSNAVFVP